MDLSGLKWPIIIALVVGVGWLLSSGGTQWMFNNYTKAEVGADPARDKIDEAGLSKLGGFMLLTFRYQKADRILQAAITRYPNGAHVARNIYRQAKCAEKLKDYRRAVALLRTLVAADASQQDKNVPSNDVLKVRIQKLVEVHGLQ